MCKNTQANWLDGTRTQLLMTEKVGNPHAKLVHGTEKTGKVRKPTGQSMGLDKFELIDKWCCDVTKVNDQHLFG